MGACLCSNAPADILEGRVDGNGAAYRERFREGKVLGWGNFALVKLVVDKHNSTATTTPLASKVLQKGTVYAGNLVYPPIDPKYLKGEIDILRVLAGQHYCLRLEAVYETRQLIYIVSEYCAGGEMVEYIASQKDADWRTEDVSRVSFQLLDAVAHCAKHGVLHRDIKPENIMFTTKRPGADLRLIDFGVGVIDNPYTANKPSVMTSTKDHDRTASMRSTDVDEEGLVIHTSFIGSRFFMSPEMYQKSYTWKTDVWSAGVTLYVLAAGYPGDQVEKAFKLLHKQNRDLKQLPNLPADLPESYYEMLRDCLVFQEKSRPSAAEILASNDFVKFHQALVTEKYSKLNMTASQIQPESSPLSKASVSLRSSISRHNVALQFKAFELSVTTLLATMLPPNDLSKLLQTLLQATTLDSDHSQSEITDDDDGEESDPTKLAGLAVVTEGIGTEEKEPCEKLVFSLTTKGATKGRAQNKSLQVIMIRQLKLILNQDKKKHRDVLEKMAKLPNADLYDNYAYHLSLLNEFCHGVGESRPAPETTENGNERSTGRKRTRSNSLKNFNDNASNSAGSFVVNKHSAIGSSLSHRRRPGNAMSPLAFNAERMSALSSPGSATPVAEGFRDPS